ncbi:hypothetical protein [Nocardioides luteus]|uniref:PIN domain-containing protein n=1 Tax=Nocardioides luteus TaxID=1844 RepID=A0A1J4NDL5_9ACTN|nr:hypothetical protein [Nocardioides luteus]OIJ28569.1 hypothetical protein UG56_001965 [Nocardioides luteus]
MTDTSTYTHLCRAGHSLILEKLAPGGVILVPDAVNVEIERGRVMQSGIPRVSDVSWAELAVLTDDEVWTQLQVKAEMGGGVTAHIGECAVIACAQHRGLTALIDDRAAVVQADLRGVPSHDTLWLVVEAYKSLFDRDREQAARVVDDLLATGMYLPITSGKSLFSWAYEEGILP